jgi:hypothetical protein
LKILGVCACEQDKIARSFQFAERCRNRLRQLGRADIPNPLFLPESFSLLRRLRVTIYEGDIQIVAVPKEKQSLLLVSRPLNRGFTVTAI